MLARSLPGGGQCCSLHKWSPGSVKWKTQSHMCKSVHEQIGILWIWFSRLAYSYPPPNILSAFMRIAPNDSRWLRLKNEAERGEVDRQCIQGVNGTRVVVLYRRSTFYCASQRLCVLWLKVCGQPCIKQVSWHHFPVVFPHCVNLSHFVNSRNISNFFFSIRFVMVICDRWSLVLLL